MKKKLIYIITLWGLVTVFPVLASSIGSNICITNYTQESHIISVSGIDDYDWDKEADRPDAESNFKHLELKPNQPICKHLETNYNASSVAFNFNVDDQFAARVYTPNSLLEAHIWYPTKVEEQLRRKDSSFIIITYPYSACLLDSCTNLFLHHSIKGNYLNRCLRINFDSWYLSGSCLNDESQETFSSLYYDNCAPNSTVSSIDGKLTCDRVSGS